MDTVRAVKERLYIAKAEGVALGQITGNSSKEVSVGESHGHVDCESAGHADIFATAYALYLSPLTNQSYTITNSITIRIF